MKKKEERTKKGGKRIADFLGIVARARRRVNNGRRKGREEKKGNL